MALIENTQYHKSRREWDKKQRLIREQEFRVVNGKAVTVGLPRQIELEGLLAMSRIKPWTKKEERSYLEASMKAAALSLREVK